MMMTPLKRGHECRRSAFCGMCRLIMLKASNNKARTTTEATKTSQTNAIDTAVDPEEGASTNPWA